MCCPHNLKSDTVVKFHLSKGVSFFAQSEFPRIWPKDAPFSLSLPPFSTDRSNE